MVFGDPSEVHDDEEFAEFLEEMELPPMTQFEYMRDYEAEDIIREREESRIADREYLV